MEAKTALAASSRRTWLVLFFGILFVEKCEQNDTDLIHRSHCNLWVIYTADLPCWIADQSVHQILLLLLAEALSSSTTSFLQSNILSCWQNSLERPLEMIEISECLMTSSRDCHLCMDIWCSRWRLSWNWRHTGSSWGWWRLRRILTSLQHNCKLALVQHFSIDFIIPMSENWELHFVK